MQVRFRCPNCKKLFSTLQSSLKQGPSSFSCNDCETVFYFNSEWVHPGEIVPTYKEGEAPDHQLAAKMTVTEACPKCGAINMKTSRECYSCGVLLEKVRGLPKDPTLNATPSLVRLWEEVINNFEDPAWHDQFIKACDLAGALQYGAFQYRMIIHATGGDGLAIDSLRKIEALQVIRMMPKTKTGFLGAGLFRQSLFVAPFVFGFGLLGVGLLQNESQNHLIGNGFAVLCISVGLSYFLKDRLFD